MGGIMNSARILIVEDDDNLRQVIQIQLAREGYETSSASSAEEAVTILDKSLFQLVLTDLSLPGGDDGCDCADLWGNGNGQGTRSEGYPHAQQPARAALHNHQLRRDSQGTAGVGAVRAR